MDRWQSAFARIVVGMAVAAAVLTADAVGASLPIAAVTAGTLAAALCGLGGQRKRRVKELEQAMAAEARAAEARHEADEMKNVFLESLAHDVRNPMSVVLGLSHVLAHKGDRLTEEQRKDSLLKIVTAAKEADRLLANLLEANLPEGRAAYRGSLSPTPPVKSDSGPHGSEQRREDSAAAEPDTLERDRHELPVVDVTKSDLGSLHGGR